MDGNDTLELARHGWRLDSLERWRRDTVEPALGKVARMERADEIAEAVSNKLHRENVLRLTFLQKAGAFLLGVVTLADLIRGLTS